MLRYFTRPPEINVDPDDEGISLEIAIREAYKLSRLSMGYEDIARENTIAVISYLMKKWESKPNSGGSTDPPNRSERSENSYKPEWNRSLQLIHLIHDLLEGSKEEWVSDYRAGKRNLDNQRMIAWFVEENNIFALKHDSSYVTTLLRILFDYEYEDLESLFGLLDPKRSLDENSFRQRKKKFFDHFTKGTPAHPKHWIGQFLKVKEDESETGKSLQADKRFPQEKRFVSQSLTDEKLLLFMDTLMRWKPLKPSLAIPEEVLQGSFDIGPLGIDLEDLVKQQVSSDSRDAIERGRMSVLMSLPFLSGVLKAMKLRPLEENAKVPDFYLKDWDDSQGTPPVDRGNPSPNDREIEEIKIALGKKKIQRQNYSHRSVIMEVGREERLSILLDKPKTVLMKLRCGESIIKVKGRDKKGDLPLDVHFISWDESLIGLSPQKYVTLLEGGRKLEFNFAYQADLAGNLIGASVRIDYSTELNKESIAVRVKSTVKSLLQCTFKEAIPIAGAVGAVLAIFLFPLINSEVPSSVAPVGVAEQDTISTPSSTFNLQRKSDITLKDKSVGVFSGKRNKVSSVQSEDELFLYSERTREANGSLDGNTEWRLSVKKKPRKNADAIRAVRIRVLDPITGVNVATGNAENGILTLPVIQAGVYNLMVEKQGSKFSRAVKFPLNEGKYVELKKEPTPPRTDR